MLNGKVSEQLCIALLVGTTGVVGALPVYALTEASQFAVTETSVSQPSTVERSITPELSEPPTLSEKLNAPAPRPIGFYDEQGGNVTDLFGTQVKLTAQQEVRHFNEKLPTSERVAPAQSGAPTYDSTSDSKANQGAERPKSREELLARYGSPAERMPVLAKDDSPKAFQAIMAARELGDAELEAAYTKQYVDYLLELDSRTKEVAAQVSREMERRKGGSVPSRAASSEEQESDTNPALFGKVKPSTAAARLAPQAGTNAKPEVGGELSQSDRARIPVDPKGEVDVLWFFDPKDPQALAMAKVANQIFLRSSKDSSISFTALTLGSESAASIDAFRAKAQVNFMPRPGLSLAAGLGFTTSPTTVLMTRKEGKSVNFEGVKSMAFLQAVLDAAQGRGR